MYLTSNASFGTFGLSSHADHFHHLAQLICIHMFSHRYQVVRKSKRMTSGREEEERKGYHPTAAPPQARGPNGFWIFVEASVNSVSVNYACVCICNLCLASCWPAGNPRDCLNSCLMVMGGCQQALKLLRGYCVAPKNDGCTTNDERKMKDDEGC